jgi:hypothetical protein
MADETVTLDADLSTGESAYTRIQNALGAKSIETGDFMRKCHLGFEHIKQQSDEPVGDHFAFFMHLSDCDPTCGSNRQRCEIKVAETSDMRGLENRTFTYSWLFKIDGEMPVSKHFTHLFQLKSVKGDDDHPILTITGEKRHGVDKIRVLWSAPTDGTHNEDDSNSDEQDVPLAENEWPSARGVWLHAVCRAKFAVNGFVSMTVKTHPEGNELLNVPEQPRNLWRNGDFVRPKWGIYRSLLDFGNLRDVEEIVRFAKIRITKEQAPDPPPFQKSGEAPYA